MSKILATALLILLPLSSVGGLDVPAASSLKDDSDLIISRLKEAMDAYGLISVEQETGRLLFNPSIEKLQTMQLKQKFLVPAMIINQKAGLKIIDELPFTCFLISGNEMANETYKGFKQFEIARYIRDVRDKNLSRVLICQAVGMTGVKAWGRALELNQEDNKFVFEEHTNQSGERFFYYLNSDGLFEMYL